MSRNLYILAASLLLFSLISCGVAWTNVAHQPGSPGDMALWRTIGLVLMLLGLMAAAIGTFTAMFEQSTRRSEQQSRRSGNRNMARNSSSFGEKSGRKVDWRSLREEKEQESRHDEWKRPGGH